MKRGSKKAYRQQCLAIQNTEDAKMAELRRKLLKKTNFDIFLRPVNSVFSFIFLSKKEAHKINRIAWIFTHRPQSIATKNKGILKATRLPENLMKL